jgi:hypothetical protein
MADKEDVGLLESLAEVFHDAWWHWSESVAPDIKDAERVARWKEFWVKYDALDESTKDLDREWAREALKKIKPYMDKAKIAKEMVTKVEVDSKRYPGISNILESSSGNPMIDDLALPLLTDAVLQELENPGEDWSEEDKEILNEMQGAIEYPQAELTETMPAYFAQSDFGWHRYLPTGLVEKILAAFNRDWEGKATFEEFYKEFPLEAAHAMLGAIGHGVSLEDEPKAVEWLKAKGITKLSPGDYFENDYDSAWSLISDYIAFKEGKNE